MHKYMHIRVRDLIAVQTLSQFGPESCSLVHQLLFTLRREQVAKHKCTGLKQVNALVSMKTI